MRLEEQLKEMGRDLPIPHVDPSASVGRVVRRGRVRQWFTRGVTVAMTLTSGVAAAVVGPQIVERPAAPTVMGEVETITVVPEEKPAPIVGDDAEKGDGKVVAPVVEQEKTEEPKSEEPATEEKATEEKATEAPVADTTPPAIEVLAPSEGSTSEDKTIAFEGEVEPGSRVFAGSYEADVTDSGAWRIVLVLAKGKNVVTFKAIDEAGNKAYDSVTVYYEPTTAEQPPSTVFTATQEKGRVAYDPPYSYYSGKAAPGAKVKVLSEYGSASTTADSKGHWRTKVWFESAPSGVATWPVTVKNVATGETKVFEFTGERPEQADLYLTANQQWNTIDAPFENVYWGTATPGQKVKVYSDYGWGWVYADESGNWELAVTFDPPAGEKTFTVYAKLYEHPNVNQSFQLTTLREGATVAFTASNVYGECNEVEPYDVYYGTAAPGSTVKIYSDYIPGGYVAVPVDGSGNWEKQVFFDSPRNTEFQVTVKSLETGETKVFSMYVGP